MKIRSVLLLLSAVPLFSVPSSFAWGNKGHKIINRLAAESLPADMPAFMRTPEAINEIEYLGPEPDRWRSRAEPALDSAQAPDHFIDIEYADLIGSLPRQRYQYIAALYAYIAAHPDRGADLRPEKVGFQPYITSEVWERLKSAMRDYRTLTASHADTKPVEAAILFYAGWLGHYVGDGSQPLHVTIQYNGWVGANPNGYTTEHHIHSLFESTFVDAAINTSDVQALMAPVHPINDEWDDYLAYLRHTGSLAEKVYQLEKAQGFEATGSDESRHFAVERIAAGASMLRDLYVAAWQKSADPVPEWHPDHSDPKPAASASALAAESTHLDPLREKIYDAGGDVKPPFLMSAPPLDVSLHGARSPTRCILEFVVDRNGVARDIRVVQRAGQDIDDRVVESIEHSRFKPGTLRGQPVPVRTHFEITFRPSN